MSGLIAMILKSTVIKALLRSLWWGFVVGLFVELSMRAFVMVGFLSVSFHGFLVLVFWCIHSNYFYYFVYAGTENKIWHDAIASLVFALTFSTATQLLFFLQEFESTAPVFLVFGLSMMLSCISFFAVRLQEWNNARR